MKGNIVFITTQNAGACFEWHEDDCGNIVFYDDDDLETVLLISKISFDHFLKCIKKDEKLLDTNNNSPKLFSLGKDKGSLMVSVSENGTEIFFVDAPETVVVSSKASWESFVNSVKTDNIRTRKK